MPFTPRISFHFFQKRNLTSTPKPPWIWVMQFLIAITTLALVILLFTATAAPSAAPNCVSNSKVFTTLPKSFTLRILFQDDRGLIDLKGSKPVVSGSYETVSRDKYSTLIVGSADGLAVVFLLKDSLLYSSFFDDDIPYGLENPDYETNPNGPRSISAAILRGSKPSYNFTAVQACDRNGRAFLRLGQNIGEFFTNVMTQTTFCLKQSSPVPEVTLWLTQFGPTLLKFPLFPSRQGPIYRSKRQWSGPNFLEDFSIYGNWYAFIFLLFPVDTLQKMPFSPPFLFSRSALPFFLPDDCVFEVKETRKSWLIAFHWDAL